MFLLGVLVGMILMLAIVFFCCFGDPGDDPW